MKRFLLLTLLFFGVIALFAVGGLVFVLLAYGIGWILTRFLPFSIFEATLLSLIGLSAIGMTIIRFVITALITPLPVNEKAENEEDGEWDEEGLDDFDNEPDEPSWSVSIDRSSERSLDFSNVKPDDRCPCGSGRKYKNCHGRGIKSQTRSDR